MRQRVRDLNDEFNHICTSGRCSVTLVSVEMLIQSVRDAFHLPEDGWATWARAQCSDRFTVLVEKQVGMLTL